MRQEMQSLGQFFPTLDAGVTSPSPEHAAGGVEPLPVSLPVNAPAWRCWWTPGGPSVDAGSTGDGKARGEAAARARGAWVAGADFRWPLVFVFFRRDGGGDLLCGNASGSGVFFRAKVTFFPLPLTPFWVTLPGRLEELSWPVRSTRKYIPCEFFFFCTVTHPLFGKEGTKRPTLPYGFFSTT
jgi:hypothetical protein